MRLIDADALFSEIKTREDESDMPALWYNGVAFARWFIFHAPTIEAEPVKHGEWVREDEYSDLWVCDQCGFAVEYKDNYCPNCGARMDGGDENE